VAQSLAAVVAMAVAVAVAAPALAIVAGLAAMPALVALGE
jgi:hypothetical protein